MSFPRVNGCCNVTGCLNLAVTTSEFKGTVATGTGSTKIKLTMAVCLPCLKLLGGVGGMDTTMASSTS